MLILVTLTTGKARYLNARQIEMLDPIETSDLDENHGTLITFASGRTLVVATPVAYIKAQISARAEAGVL